MRMYGAMQKIIMHSACREFVENRRASPLQRPCRRSSCNLSAGTLQKILMHAAYTDVAINRLAFRLQVIAMAMAVDMVMPWPLPIDMVMAMAWHFVTGVASPKKTTARKAIC